MLKQLAAANNAAAAGMQGARTRPKMPNMAPQKSGLPGSTGTGVMDGGFDPRGLGDVMSKLTVAKNALETGKRLGPDHSSGRPSGPTTGKLFYILTIFNAIDCFLSALTSIREIKYGPITGKIFFIFEPWHEISNNVVCATSKGSDQPAHTRSLIRAFSCRLTIL